LYLSKKTGRHKCTIMQKHLWKLERNNIVMRELNKNQYLWSLTNKGKKIANEILNWNKVY